MRKAEEAIQAATEATAAGTDGITEQQLRDAARTMLSCVEKSELLLPRRASWDGTARGVWEAVKQLGSEPNSPFGHVLQQLGQKPNTWMSFESGIRAFVNITPGSSSSSMSSRKTSILQRLNQPFSGSSSSSTDLSNTSSFMSLSFGPTVHVGTGGCDRFQGEVCTGKCKGCQMLYYQMLSDAVLLCAVYKVVLGLLQAQSVTRAIIIRANVVAKMISHPPLCTVPVAVDDVAAGSAGVQRGLPALPTKRQRLQ